MPVLQDHCHRGPGGLCHRHQFALIAPKQLEEQHCKRHTLPLLLAALCSLLLSREQWQTCLQNRLTLDHSSSLSAKCPCQQALVPTVRLYWFEWTHHQCVLTVHHPGVTPAHPRRAQSGNVSFAPSSTGRRHPQRAQSSQLLSSEVLGTRMGTPKAQGEFFLFTHTSSQVC